MSLADQMLSDVGDVFMNTDDHARVIAVLPPGRSATSTNVTGVWDVIEEEEVDIGRGKEIVYKATFCSAAGTVIQSESRVTVDSLDWTCISPGATYVGMKCSTWTAREPLHRMPKGGSPS